MTNTASEKNILIVGSMAFDDLQFPVPTLDPDGSGVTRTSFENVVGGSATYAALAASCYTGVRIVAVVGDDFPEATLELLRSRGVSTEGVQRQEGKTFRWSGRYHDDLVGRDTLDTQLNVFADFKPSLPDNYKSSPIVMLGNIHPALQLAVLEQVDSPELVVADTMNYWIDSAASDLARVLERIDLLVINDEEARQLSGLHNISQAAGAILGMGPKRLIIKRGEYGSLYFDAHGVFAAPALPLEHVCDPTGAGDAFAGGLLGAMAAGDALDATVESHEMMRRAMIHGTATASFCVQAVGASRLESLAISEVDGRLRRIRELARVPQES